jgi:thioredoxin reductase (NADPH)
VTTTTHDLVVVGAGPAGLSAAIAAARAGLDYEVVEQGGIVEGIYRFPAQMVFFTTPELLEIGGLPFVTPHEKPTRHEALKYYRRVADTFDLRLAFGERVTVIDRGEEPGGMWLIESRRTDGETVQRTARAVIVATGYYGQPNVMGIPGEDLPHVSHYYTEAHGCYRKHVVVVGGKNSAAEAALELHRAGARVTLVHRDAALGEGVKYWVRPDIENRIAEGAIAARFGTHVRAITPRTVEVEGPLGEESLPAGAVFLMTGYHPDFDLLRRAGVTIDAEKRVAVYDAETFETAVPNLFLAGGVVSGPEAPSVFIENGRFHGAKVVDVLLRRWGRDK